MSTETKPEANGTTERPVRVVKEATPFVAEYIDQGQREVMQYAVNLTKILLELDPRDEGHQPLIQKLRDSRMGAELSGEIEGVPFVIEFSYRSERQAGRKGRVEFHSKQVGED